MKHPQLFPSKTWDLKTRRNPACFVHKICPIHSRGLDCVSLSTIFGRWCSDELLFHGRKSLSKCFPRFWRANSISQQPADSIGGHTVHIQVILISGIPPEFDSNEYQIFNPTQSVYTTQHYVYCPASWHRARTKGDVPSASLVEQLKGNYEQGVRGTQDRLKGQKLLEGDQPVWRRKRIWWQSLHHQISSF